MSAIKLNSSGGGSITISPASTASTLTLTAPAQTGTIGIQGPAFGVYRSTNQSITGGTLTKIQFDAEEYDTANCFDSTTNYRFTPNVAGYYQINAAWQILSAPGAAGQVGIVLYKNNAIFKWGAYGPNNVATPYTANLSSVVYCNGTTDYIEVYAYVGNSNTIAGLQSHTYANGGLIRGA